MVDTLGSGGKERRVVELARGLSTKSCIELSLVILSDQVYFEEVLELPISIYYIKRKSRKDPAVYFRIYEVLKEIRPHFVHSFESMVSIYAMPVVRLMGITFINAMISNAPQHIKVFSKLWFRSKLTFPFSHAVVANSFAGLQAYQAPLNKSYYIHNGFNFDRLKNLKDPISVRKSLGVGTKRVIGMAATFSSKKDYRTYLFAAQEVLKKRNDVIFLCIGDGHTLNESKKLVAPKFNDIILFTGNIKDIESVMNILTIGVLATYTEGISNSVMEYMALSKPVIVTEGGGSNELVKDGYNGFLVQRESVNDLVSKLNLLLDNDILAKEMGDRSLQLIQEKFSIENMVDKTVDLYQDLLK
jgi:glycosyltransferase involved in cell wall biosynthesis